MDKVLKLKKWIKTAKSTILIVAVLTIVNTVLIAVNADTVFTFSAYIPQLITAVFAELALEEGNNSLIFIGAAISIFIALIYVAIWQGSKKKDSLITVSLVLFSIDSGVLLFDAVSYFDVSFIIDIFFHGWVIFDLIMGVSSYSKLKKMPEELRVLQQNEEQTGYYNPVPMGTDANNNAPYQPAGFENEQADSTPIRISENKGRAVISAEYNGMNVEVRRSRGLTELIVDGKVYAEQKGIVETEYTLYAKVSGVLFSVTMTVQSVMFLYADGQEIAKKIRLI